MRTWLHSVIVILTVGGGFTGFVVITQFLPSLHQGPRGAAQVTIGVAFALLYVFVLLAGLLFVHNPRRTLPVIVAVALQVPVVSSPLVSYRFSAGAHATVWAVGGRIGAAVRLGSDFQFTILQPQPWGLGVNLFALVLMALILRARTRDHHHPTAAAVNP